VKPSIKKILIIPSWYPTKEQPNLGIFFKEQALLMAEEFNVLILVGVADLIGRKKYLRDKILLKNHKSTIKLLESSDSKNYKEYTFNYPLYCFKSKSYQHVQIIRYYEKALLKLGFYPDLIHAQGNIMGGIIATGLSKKNNYKTLITEHLPLIINNFNYDLKEAYFSALTDANCISTVSEDARASLINNIPSKDIINHGNFIDENLFTLKKEKNKDCAHHIAWVGSLYHRKDPFTFIRALKEIRKQNVSCKATMVFASEYGEVNIEEVIKFIDSQGLTQNIKIQYNQSRSELVNLYQVIDLLICTSINETFGMIIAEAIMCGTPVISTNNGGVNDIINHGVNGFITKVKDFESIALHVTNILNDKIDLNTINLRETVISRYGRVAFKKRISNLYNSIINS
jgi:glycosyltransferase involved in cell wall biosynthesis